MCLEADLLSLSKDKASLVLLESAPSVSYFRLTWRNGQQTILERDGFLHVWVFRQSASVPVNSLMEEKGRRALVLGASCLNPNPACFFFFF